MAQPSNLPEAKNLTSEYDLRNLLDEFYAKTKATLKEGIQPQFNGLLEYMKSEVTILTAIHNIKSNKGSQTPGSDGETMREHILEQDYPEVILRVQQSLTWYEPRLIRRKYIPKPGKTEKRKLGIPGIIDRIVQECVRILIEPILEAQFFQHSYGFRPIRDAHMALGRATSITHQTGYQWIIEVGIQYVFAPRPDAQYQKGANQTFLPLMTSSSSISYRFDGLNNNFTIHVVCIYSFLAPEPVSS